MKELSKAEEMVLLAIWRLKDNAYGKTIRREILKNAGRDYTYGTLYGLLWQLASKDFVLKILADPTPEQGGRSKTYYRLSSQGIQALKRALELHNRVWKDIDDCSFDET